MTEGTQLTRASRAFLTAEWRRLALFTYAVEPARLEAIAPPGLTLDTRDGHAFVSLVAFDFLNTKVLGVGWPGFRNFPEINLRYYVRKGETRGVAFVRELVPSRLIAWIARTLYNEPYQRLPMVSRAAERDGALQIEHVVMKNGRENRIRVEADAATTTPPEDSIEHFFKEHSWGFGRSRRGELVEYEVRHPVWAVHHVRDFDLDWDFSAIYGPEWSDLASATPYSVVLAEGSAISVSPKL